MNGKFCDLYNEHVKNKICKKYNNIPTETYSKVIHGNVKKERIKTLTRHIKIFSTTYN